MNANRYAAGVCCALLLCIAGCAAGRGPGGEVVVGFDVAKLPETTAQLASHAAGFLPEPFGTIASGLVLSVGSGIAAHYRGVRAGERKGWDERDEALRARERDKLLAGADPSVATAAITVGAPIPGVQPVAKVGGA